MYFLYVFLWLFKIFVLFCSDLFVFIVCFCRCLFVCFLTEKEKKQLCKCGHKEKWRGGGLEGVGGKGIVIRI